MGQAVLPPGEFCEPPREPEPAPITCPAFTGATTGTSGIAGKIVDGQGQPVIGATISVSGGAETSPVITEEDGTYSFTLAPGTYGIDVYAGASHEARPCTEAIGGKTTRLDVTIAL